MYIQRIYIYIYIYTHIILVSPLCASRSGQKQPSIYFRGGLEKMTNIQAYPFEPAKTRFHHFGQHR